MSEKKFLDDVQKLYNFISTQKDEINKLYSYLEKQQYDKLNIIDEFERTLGLKSSDELKLALVTRLINLRDDSLVQILKKQDFSDTQVIELQEKAYQFSKDYWLELLAKRIEFIKENKLLTPFYTVIFDGVYDVGVAMSKWQSSWTAKIINGVNKELLEKFNQDEQKVFKYLDENDLFDKGHEGLTADRSYSSLVKKGGGYESKAYIESFKKEVTDVIDALERFVDSLVELEDDIYDQKWEYILYLQALIAAFGENKVDNLVNMWSKVDEAWMKITTPIQIGHPLEYYEDHFRKAVALEWDIRLSNPSFEKNNQRVSKMKNMFSSLYSSIDDEKEYKEMYDFSFNSLDKVQLYLGRPALFFGAEYNGLFSAQVVPNDEIISAKEGKKIFAFSDEILQGQRAKPFLKLSREIFGQEFLSSERKFLFNEDKKWHQVYDITTIGHEYGHILWCDEETESVMNKSGNFKNIEEFKATTGGLVSFFMDSSNDEKELEPYVISDTIKRAVSLIGWMEVDEVLPYYCEGLIHLYGLFVAGVLNWNKEAQKLTINTCPTSINTLKSWYIKTYKQLALTYLYKKDASSFLYQFAMKNGSYFTSTDETIDNFIQYYFERYKEIGQEIDTNDTKENYIV
jgi:molecular chaperone GrpE (heat shock protein)